MGVMLPVRLSTSFRSTPTRFVNTAAVSLAGFPVEEEHPKLHVRGCPERLPWTHIGQGR